MHWLIAAAGAVLVATCVAITSLGDLLEALPNFLILFAIAFASYATAILIVRRHRPLPRWVLPFILFVGLLARFALVPATPSLSTDMYRYLWEGRVIAAGFNPFSHAPDDAELAFLRDENYQQINHKHLETIYPPVSQLTFFLGTVLHPSLTAQKVLFVLFDMATVLLMIPLLRHRGDDPVWSVVLAWNPLVIFETAHSGHLDAIGIFFLMLGIWMFLSGRRLVATVALSASFLSKYLAGIVVVYLIRHRHFRYVALAAGLIAIGFLPFASAGSKLTSSLALYATEWHFNSVAFLVFHKLTGDPLWTRYLLAGIVGLLTMVLAWREKDIARYTYLTIAAVLLLSPTLYPWYVAWIVPFLCMFRNRAWILFTGLVFVSYWVWAVMDQTGEWALPAAVYAAEFLPFAALALWDTFQPQSRTLQPA